MKKGRKPLPASAPWKVNRDYLENELRADLQVARVAAEDRRAPGVKQRVAGGQSVGDRNGGTGSRIDIVDLAGSILWVIHGIEHVYPEFELAALANREKFHGTKVEVGDAGGGEDIAP